VRSEKSGSLQHLVLVRHGESEGDVRREAWGQGDSQAASKRPEFEELTDRGIDQCRIAGRWITKNIIDSYDLEAFDGYFVSPALRSEQSAIALNLPNAAWQVDNNLNERNRGLISGLRPEEHQRLYPRSFDEMQNKPLHWLPPQGEALIPDIVDGIRQFITAIKKFRAVIAVTHRDRMWVALLPLESLTETQLVAINSDDIHNGQVVHYTSVDPVSREVSSELSWKRSVDPAASGSSTAWQKIITL